MAFLNKQPVARPEKGTQAYYLSRSSTARYNFLLFAVMTLINVLMVVADSGRMFLFSAWLPYWQALVSTLIKEYGYFAVEVFGSGSLVVALLFIAALAVCFALWKKHIAFPMVAVGLLAVDTLYMIWWAVAFSEMMSEVGMDVVLCGLFHAWMCYYGYMAVEAALKLKKMNEQQLPVTQNPYQGPEF